MQKVMGEREPFQENGIVCQKRSWLLLRIMGTLGCTCIFVHFLFNYLECVSRSSSDESKGTHIYKSGYICLDSLPNINSTHQVYENVHFPTF